ncbi:MAG TPA: sugar phosphate isomerase/epimerase family protein [Bryobacteraceae bacterium]|nr:sugar phosphate isomerase/epimerase family protein [Bryobacteraceae bacterium]
MTVSRRHFIGTTLAAGLAAAQKPKKLEYKVSLNAYSFNKMLNDSIKGRAEGITLIKVIEFAAKNKFEGVDPTGYFLPGYPAVPKPSYVEELKKRAADLGLGISGTGVRNNFTTADKAVRDQGVAHIKQWVEVAAQLGAPVVRVFADTQMRAQNWQTVSNGASRADVQNYIAAALRECADCGKKYGVRIGVQNHGDFLQTGEELMTLIKAVGSEWCGPIVDTGYFKTPDPYVDIALVAPHALNWQIKQSPLGEDSEVPTDLNKLMRIIRKSGYLGYLPIETLSPRGKPYDPFTVIPAFADQLRAAIKATA